MPRRPAAVKKAAAKRVPPVEEAPEFPPIEAPEVKEAPEKKRRRPYFSV